MPQQRRRRCRASQGLPGHEKRTPTAADAHDLKIVVKLRAVPTSKVPFPVEIAGFPDFSRPVPVYPAFLKYVVPVQAQTTPEQVLSVLPALLTAAACGVFGTMVAALLCAKLLRIPISLAAAYGISCTFGFPTTMLIPQEVSEAFGRNEKEKKAILNFLLPKMLTAGFVTVTIVSVLIAGAAVKML